MNQANRKQQANESQNVQTAKKARRLRSGSFIYCHTAWIIAERLPYTATAPPATR